MCKVDKVDLDSQSQYLMDLIHGRNPGGLGPAHLLVPRVNSLNCTSTSTRTGALGKFGFVSKRVSTSAHSCLGIVGNEACVGLTRVALTNDDDDGTIVS